MAKDLVHRIVEFPLGTPVSKVEELMNREGVIDPQLNIVSETRTVGRHGRMIRKATEHMDAEYETVSVPVQETKYIVYYREAPKN